MSGHRARLSAVAVLWATALLWGCATGADRDGRVPARLVCNDGQVLKVTFVPARQLAILRLQKDKTAELASQRPASGMWFKGAGFELRGAGDTFRFSSDGKPPVRCIQTR